MKILTLGFAAAALMIAAGTASAIPTLTISDDAGHSVTVSDPTGLINWSGAVGDWKLNFEVGQASPPMAGATATQPKIDLLSGNDYYTPGTGVTNGSVLTITFAVDNVGPINGSVHQSVGGTLDGVSPAVFTTLVNGSSVASHSFTGTGSFAANDEGSSNVGQGSTLTLTTVLKANGSGIDIATFDYEVSVPDNGMTLAMLGAGLAGLVLFARTRKTA